LYEHYDAYNVLIKATQRLTAVAVVSGRCWSIHLPVAVGRRRVQLKVESDGETVGGRSTAMAAAAAAAAAAAGRLDVSLFLCEEAPRRRRCMVAILVRQHGAASTIFDAASTPVAAARVIISAPSSDAPGPIIITAPSSVGLWRAGRPRCDRLSTRAAVPVRINTLREICL